MIPKIYLPYLDWIDTQHDVMVERVIELSNINSGSQNIEGLRKMGNSLLKLFAKFETEPEIITLPHMSIIDNHGRQQQQPVGQALSWRKHPDAALQILLVGHMDTVYGESHEFQSCLWLDDKTLNGPGVADLKGGLIIMLTALEALERSRWAGSIGWRVFINPDEEIGSLSSALLLENFAKQYHLGFVFEPALPDGTLAGARKGSGNFSIIATGKSAHAGREHHLGRNAIRALSEFVVALDNLNGEVDGITINPGFIHGGGPVNIVPDKAVLKFNIRISAADDEQWFLNKLNQIIKLANNNAGIAFQRHGGFGRKPKLLDPQTKNLFELIENTGSMLNMAINHKDTGGACDGNNLAAAGLPNVDTMGAVGGAIHSVDEYIDVISLTQRAKLNALILMRLAAGEKQWVI